MSHDLFDQPDDLWEHGEAAKKVTAQYANRIFAQPLAEDMVRVSFGEMGDNFDPSYHTALVITPELALDFADVIQRVANNVIEARSRRVKEENEAIIAAMMREKGADGRPD